MTPKELVGLGTEIVSEADTRGLTLRMYGGTAVYARCPSVETHPSLQRDYVDLDFVAASSAWEGLSGLMAHFGLTPQENTPGKLMFAGKDLLVDVRPPALREDYAFDLTARLDLVPLTLPLADLLLLKLARVNFADKDIKDATALLLDHRVGDGGDEEQEINREEIFKTANREFKLWKTVFDNTVTLEKIFDRYLEPEEGQLAWRRIERLQEVLDARSKSPSWWVGRLVSR